MVLVIYDNLGYRLFQGSGGREPNGIPFLWVDIPEGKRIREADDGIVIDVSVTPNVAILEDIPKTELEILQADQVLQLNRFIQKETDDYAFQEYVLSQLPPV